MSDVLYGTFTCKTYRDWYIETCEYLQRTGGEHPDIDRAFSPGCGAGESIGEFPAEIPFLGDELPECPFCNGPSVLMDLLVPAPVG